MARTDVHIRRGTAADGAAVARVQNAIVSEGRFTALDHPVTEDSESAWIAAFGPRSALFVAEAGGVVVGFQTLEPFQPFLRSMDHVGVAGTQVDRAHRGRGVGRALWRETSAFGLGQGYEKVVVQVRAGNDRALRFYRGVGFADVGVARRQVRIDGAYEDEVFLEAFLREPPPR
jgi:L-amino acid N-acyltransferase YncA